MVRKKEKSKKISKRESSELFGESRPKETSGLSEKLNGADKYFGISTSGLFGNGYY